MDEEERNCWCLALLINRVGVDKIRKYFILKWYDVGKKKKDFVAWTDCAQNGTDLQLKYKPHITNIGKVQSGDTTTWDLPLLENVLLESNPAFVTKKSLVNSLKCLKKIRNEVCHAPNGKIATADFEKLWNDACTALGLFGATSKDFKKVKQDVNLPLNEVTSLMKQCAKQDDEILRRLDTTITTHLEKGQHELKEEMKQVQHVMKEEMKQVQHVIKEEIKQVQHVMKEEMKQGQEDMINQLLGASSARQVQLSTGDVQLRSKFLKASTKRQTEFQPKLIASHSIASARTDEIFTNLIMQHGRKSLPKGASRREQLSEYRTLSGTPIKRSQDIFIPQQKGKTHPKSILVTGKPGIGKSLFCQKLVRDWADDVLFEEELQSTAHGFDFVYLLPLRQMNLIEEEKLTLREVLNRCSLLDEHSNIDEPLFEYMIEHQDKVLFILDGYDEYVHRENITGNRVDQKHESNPRIAMPVAALLSKLLKGKIFGEAVVMVTSRPTESNELGGMNFDALVEIAGFSPQQVEDFISKYFQSNSQMKNDVLEHFRENEELLSLAHVPMFCFLICWCMEWHMKFKTDQDFPVNMTELYSEIVHTFALKHHSKSQYRSGQIPEQFEYPTVVKTTLEKLSKLAVETMKAKKFNFQKEELMQFGLVSVEIEDFEVSGLLTSGPGLRTSATKITRYYCFSHLTLQEYFTARWYVENGNVPSLEEIDSEMFSLFLAGLSGKAKCEDLMEKLLLRVSGDGQLVISRSDDRMRLLLVRLLYEYDDKDSVVKMINRHLSRLLFFNSSGEVFFNATAFTVLPGTYYKLSSFYIDLFNLCFKNHNELVQDESELNSKEIMIYKVEVSPSMSLAGVTLLFKALSNSFCPITSVVFHPIDQGRLDVFCDALPSTNIIILEFRIHYEYKLCLMSLSKKISDPNCKVKTLFLVVNGCLDTDEVEDKMMDKLEHFKKEILRSKPDIKIVITEFDYENPDNRSLSYDSVFNRVL